MQAFGGRAADPHAQIIEIGRIARRDARSADLVAKARGDEIAGGDDGMGDRLVAAQNRGEFFLRGAQRTAKTSEMGDQPVGGRTCMLGVGKGFEELRHDRYGP